MTGFSVLAFFILKKKGSNFRALTRGRGEKKHLKRKLRQNPTSNLFPAARISCVPSGLNARSYILNRRQDKTKGQLGLKMTRSANGQESKLYFHYEILLVYMREKNNG